MSDPWSSQARRSDFRRARACARLALILLLVACRDGADRIPAASDDGPIAATDDSGREVRLNRPARRVVSLLPAGTETLFALGAGDRVVGRTRYDAEPHLAHLPSVGGGLDPSLEALVALRPDLVVAFETVGGSRIRPRLEALGIPVFGIATRDTADVFRNIHHLGRLVGRAAAADSLAALVRARLDSVRASVPGGERPRVLYAVSIDPPIVSGTDNFIAEMIEVAGGRAVSLAADQPGASPQVSREELIRLDPDLVMLPVQEEPGIMVQRLQREPGWREIRAVREGRIATLPSDVVNRPGPKIAEMARLIREAIDRQRRGS